MPEQARQLEQMLYAVSHDLREPLRMVSCFMALLRKQLGGVISEEQRELFGFAVEGATRMDSMLVDLLEYARIGQPGTKVSTVDLNTVIAHALENLRLQILQEDVLVVSSGDFPQVSGNERELERLFQNLIGNAIKFHQTDALPRVGIKWERKENSCIVSVIDNGIGIIAKDFESIFNIFHRLNVKCAAEGTGIGLAACKKIMEHHHGAIWVDSKVGRGTTFYVSLPLSDESLG